MSSPRSYYDGSIDEEGGSNTASTEPLLTLNPALAALSVRMVEINHGLQDALEVALTFGQNSSLLALYDTAASRKLTAAFRLVVENLGLSQHAAANIATRLAAAERAVEEFNQAIFLHARDVEKAASPGCCTSGESLLQKTRGVQQLVALLEKNKQEARLAEQLAIIFAEKVARHYRERAELLLSTHNGDGDERAVMVLVMDDKNHAEQAFAQASRESGTSMSSEGYVHRAATVRLHKLVIAMKKIEGLDV